MLIQDIEKKFPPFHEPAAKAAYLIETGKFVRYVETPTPDLYPNLVWAVKPGPRVDDYEYPPYIHYSCGKCGMATMSSGPNAAAQLVRHCGVVEPVPEHIAVKFKDMRDKYWSRSKKKQPPQPGSNKAVDTRRDQLVAESLGYKPREVLIAEVQAHAASVKGS